MQSSKAVMPPAAATETTVVKAVTVEWREGTSIRLFHSPTMEIFVWICAVPLCPTGMAPCFPQFPKREGEPPLLTAAGGQVVNRSVQLFQIPEASPRSSGVLDGSPAS